MSEDTAHGEHFEPSNGAASPAQAQQAGTIPQMTIKQALDAQVRRVATLSTRVESLLQTTQEAFSEFVMESASLFQTLSSFAQELESRHNDSRPTNSATTQASA